jgi:hypothetical protein
MTLDATAREANIRDSLKKFFVDTYSVPMSFDKALSQPDLQGRTVHKWINVIIHVSEISILSDILVHVYCCTRQDNEYFKLSQLRDTVVEQLSVDPNSGQSDNMKRITFYQSHPVNPWTEIGKLLVTEVFESIPMEGPDETKYKILTVRLRAPAKV